MKHKFVSWVLHACVLSLMWGGLTAGSVAHAQSPGAPAPTSSKTQLDGTVPDEIQPEDPPWTIGVSEDRQKQAKILYQSGNRYFSNGLFAAAVAKYRAALQHWSHPGIHYNLALALVSLDRPIEAYESIAEALRYGPDALQPDEYRRALDYQRMLQRQIAEIEVVCEEPGAMVTVDGKPLFTGPGRSTTRLPPGKHQIVASKARYITTSQAVTLVGMSHTRVELRLLPEDQATMQIRRWPSWTPWSVAGLGFGTGAAASVLHLQSDINSRRLGQQLANYCAAGCDAFPSALRPLQRRVILQRNVAYIGYATAGTLIVTAVVLAYINRPETVESKALHDLVRISLHPGGPEGSTGMSIHVPF